ncbi:MAG: CDP-glycerol glycerophosphotransferase family protein [Gammaproteobacteria bacterium]
MAPFTWLIPRNPALWLIIGREHGLYLDNAKYFHAWLCGNLPPDQQAVFLSEHARTLDTLAETDASTVRYPSAHAFSVLLRAGTVVTDTADFREHGRVGFLRGARMVQLWHGAPLKDIELAHHAQRLRKASEPLRTAVKIQKWVIGRYASVDTLVSTSGFFTERVFRHCFNARNIIETGYPRNDMLYGGDDYPRTLVRIGVDLAAWERLAGHRRGGGKVALYAPTFRRERNSPFADGRIDLERLSGQAVAENVLIALKLHPFMRGLYLHDAYPGIVEIAADSDIYPLLREVDVLATDYSSIFFDYLLLDRPMVFYPYDYENYVSQDHRLLFGYEDMTPGPKAGKTEDFDSLLFAALRGTDDWAAERDRVKRLVFDHEDGHASRRIQQWLARNSGASEQ